jgi:hypothetical protein
MKSAELPLSAQTAYAELAEQTRAFETNSALSGLTGSFQKLKRKDQEYWYFAFRDADKVRMSYVGPNDDRVRALIARFKQGRRKKPLAPAAQSAIALGCAPTAPKHFRIIKRLAEYGFFRAGGVLVGTHAFVAYGNMLGIRWSHGSATLDVDFAHAGRNVSVALPADLKIDVHGALESLEMGLLPMGQTVVMPELNLALEPLKFMEYSLESTTQGCIFGNIGACTVNLPAPERYAVHKLIVYGERPVSERTKAKKDLMQSASLAEYFAGSGQARTFNRAWRDALERGPGWRKRVLEGKKALLHLAPELDKAALWKE